MRFSCDKATLFDTISICIHAISSKASSPVLEGFLISAASDSATMSGYNYKTAITRSFDATVFEDGSAVLSAKLLSDIVRKLPDEIVEITIDEKMMATIRCASCEYNLPATAAQEFPEIPKVTLESGIALSNSELKEIIGGTVFAVSTNENKPIHTGSLFEINEDLLTVVSVDGYRLAIRTAQIKNTNGGSFKFVVPGDTLKELARILPDDDEPCNIYPERKHALFEFGGTVLITRLLEGEFLNYMAAIPADQPIKLQMSRSELIASVERVSLIVSERLKNPVRCIFDDTTLKLSCITAIGRSYDECRIPKCEQAIEIGFNNGYLLDALRACPDEDFILELKSGLAPCTIKPLEGNSFLYLVLPVRLGAGQ